MANVKILRLVPNATYIPLTGVGGFALGDVNNLRHPTQNSSVAWGALPNANPRSQVFCVAVEYRLKKIFLKITVVFSIDFALCNVRLMNYRKYHLPLLYSSKYSITLVYLLLKLFHCQFLNMKQCICLTF